MSNVPSKELRRRAKELREIAAREERALAERKNNENPIDSSDSIIILMLIVVFILSLIFG